MEPLEYLHLQLRLEGREVLDERFLRQVEAVPDEDLPLMVIAQLADEELVAYYAETISGDLRKKLDASLPEYQFPKIDSLLHILTSDGLPGEVGIYKTYVFHPPLPEEDEVVCLSKRVDRVKAFGFDGFAEEVFAIEQDGRIVSACVSTRENEQCGEAWVYTDPEYREQGFAQKVLNAWARSLIEAGKVPFYSHKIENIPSALLARKLRLQPVFEEIVVSLNQ